MLGFVLFSEGIPVSAFLFIGLISLVSGKRYGLYSTLVWFSINAVQIWNTYLGSFTFVSNAFLGLIYQNLHKLPSYAQQQVISEPAIQSALGYFSGWMPYLIAGLTTVSTIPLMFAMGWGFFWLRPRLRNRIVTIRKAKLGP